MSDVLPLLKGTIALEEALEEDDNLLVQLEYPRQKYEFYNYLFTHEAEIAAIVAFHFGVSKCEVGEAKTWMSGSYNFPAPENVSSLTRLRWYTRRIVLSWLRIPPPCQYIRRKYPDTLRTGYLIIGYVTSGSMFSNSWMALRHDENRRLNLFRSLARIILSLNRSPLPRIGSLTLDHEGVITLTNRPLTLQLQSLENEGIPSGISRNSTYSAADSYLLDLLMCHDNRIHHQPNSIHDEDDGYQQLAALTMMRAILPQFISRDYRHGPFVFTLTDLHQSNIFVDDKWNITGLIDLEWACSLPIELQSPPYWLSGRSVDDIEHGEPLETFGQVVTEFLETFEREERERWWERPYIKRLL